MGKKADTSEKGKALREKNITNRNCHNISYGGDTMQLTRDPASKHIYTVVCMHECNKQFIHGY